MKEKKENNTDKEKLLTSVESKVLGVCESTIIKSHGLNSSVIANIPILLTKIKVGINIVDHITMPYGTSKIIRIDDSLREIKCKPMEGTNVLFIKGKIKRRIRFYSYLPSKVIGSISDIRYCTFDIPFQTAININFDIDENKDKVAFSSKEYLFLDKINTLEKCNDIICNMTDEPYNEKAYCNMLSCKIDKSTHNINSYEWINPMSPFDWEKTIEIETRTSVVISCEILKQKNVLISNETTNRK